MTLVTNRDNIIVYSQENQPKVQKKPKTNENKSSDSISFDTIVREWAHQLSKSQQSPSTFTQLVEYLKTKKTSSPVKQPRAKL
jgi:hypothetical protein